MKTATHDLNEVLEASLDGLELSKEQIAGVRSKFIEHSGGAVLYIPRSQEETKLKRNISIISQLAPLGSLCSKAKVKDLARDYNLSMSQVYRIRREAHKTYELLTELYDHENISKETYQAHLAVLKKKLPPQIIGRTL